MDQILLLWISGHSLHKISVGDFVYLLQPDLPAREHLLVTDISSAEDKVTVFSRDRKKKLEYEMFQLGLCDSEPSKVKLESDVARQMLEDSKVGPLVKTMILNGLVQSGQVKEVLTSLWTIVNQDTETLICREHKLYSEAEVRHSVAENERLCTQLLFTRTAEPGLKILAAERRRNLIRRFGPTLMPRKQESLKVPISELVSWLKEHFWMNEA